VVYFEEDKFKGILSNEEILQKLPHDTAKQELECEQEEMKRAIIDKFHRLLQHEQVENNIKEQEKDRKEEKLEQKRLQAEEEHRRR
jgi:hypothetical protein